ncbi:hypothetical protein [Pedomonas sp. V897]|uniref:hypothetical protein n=1 Tax=Pedomonas sp. V897 TaxID=3446482 RepID=UPI003EE1015B
MLYMVISFVVLLASAAVYLRLQCRALLTWRGTRRALAAAPLIGWILFFQNAAAASPGSYITPSLVPIDLWGTLFNGVIFLLIADAVFGQRRRTR